jgi:hypothetical protein
LRGIHTLNEVFEWQAGYQTPAARLDSMIDRCASPAQYRTVTVPQAVMVAPEGIQYEQTPAQNAVRQRVDMVAPARTYYVATRPRCGNCGY